MAFWAGVYDWNEGKHICSIAPNVPDIKSENWLTYEFSGFEIKENRKFWIGPGVFNTTKNETSSIEAVYLDRLEFQEIL